MAAPSPVDRDEVPPFLLKVFYRTGAFHRPDEFASPTTLPLYVPIYTWPDCTLKELCYDMATVSPSILPSPAIGTRLSFRLIFADIRAGADRPPKYVAKDLGSIVLGDGGPGIDLDDARADEAAADREPDKAKTNEGDKEDGERTLSDAKFVVGDYISCAIMPPSPATGEVAAASAARTGRGAGLGEARSSMGVAPPPFRNHGPRGHGWRGRGRDAAGPAYGGRSDGWFYGRGRPSSERERPGAGTGRLLEAEWRRGEALPEPSHGRGRGRW
ncbi:hypothetical protein P8C59_005094 [Phyllachora maydis]|uniref:Sin3-associated polypeptide Sap18 n=1 Tax=Phyllachora maydis TaxID=1825666 RepID=A0AAD9I4V2_9PEZI|nr:hypothetical protein P8C59_005094 [Phyllachora maydis]